MNTINVNSPFNQLGRGKMFGLILGLVILGLIVVGTDVVPTGRTQVITRFGRVARTSGEGLSFHIPLVERATSIDTTVKREAAQADAATSNLQQVKVSVAVNYRITQDNAVKQYQNFTKKDFVSIVVQPKIQDSIKSVTPKYTAEELVLKRPQIGDEIKDTISKALSQYGIDIVDVSIENFQFSAEYTAAVNSKSLIEQQIQAAKLTTQKIEIESSNNILQATKAAEVRRVEAQQDDKNLKFYELQIKDKAVNKWNGVAPTYVGNNNSVVTLPLQ
jgi:regulator of protease activity HflC (stomatin/prohibitin superfamily)